jgi:hypothetical protein
MVMSGLAGASTTMVSVKDPTDPLLDSLLNCEDPMAPRWDPS